MLTALSAIAGFLGSLLPKFLEMRQDKRDKEHELAIMRLQMEAQEKTSQARLEAVGIVADVEESKALYASAQLMPTNVPIIDGLLALLNGTVRPVITYAFFGIYINWHFQTNKGFGDEDMALFAAIMCYWFGSRAMQKFWGRK